MLTSNKDIKSLLGLILALVLLVTAVFFCGCSCSSVDEDEVIVSDNLLVIDNESMNESVLEVRPDYILVNQVLGIRKDSVLSSGITDKTPDGMLRKAKSVEKEGENYKVYTEQAALTDAINKCDVSYTANFKPDGSYDLVNNKSNDADSTATNIAVQKAFADALVELKINIPNNNLVDGSMSVSVNCDIQIDWGKIYLKITSRLYAGVNLKDFTKIDVSTTLFNPNLPNIQFMIGYVPVVITNDCSIDLVAKANLLSFKIKGGASFDKTFGFEYSTENGVKEINEDHSQSPYFSIENEQDRFRGAFSSALKFSYTAKLYGLAGFEAATALQGDCNADLKCVSEKEAGQGAISLAGVNSKMKGTIDAKLYVPISGHLVVSVNLFDGLFKAELINQELFNTGDAITLWELHKSYGDLKSDPDFNPTNQVVLVLDVSGSMSGEPLSALKSACTRFVKEALSFNCSLSIVEFESNASILVKDSTDTTTLNNTINGLKDKGSTNMEDGLVKADSIFNSNSNTKKSIVLMSDGLPNSGKTDSALTSYADSLKNKGITIYSLGFFHSVSGSKSAPQKLLENISSPGFHYEVDNSSSLESFFADVATQIGGGRSYYVQVACPVDVTVTYNGETLSSAGKTTSSRTSFGTLTFSEENSSESSGSSGSSKTNNAGTTKILRLKEGPAYDIKITGNGTGTMNYKIGYLNIDGQYDDIRYFSNLSINPKTVISTQAKLTDVNEMTVDNNGDGKNVVKYEAESNQQASVVKEKNPDNPNTDQQSEPENEEHEMGFFESIFQAIFDFFNNIGNSIWYFFNWG